MSDDTPRHTGDCLCEAARHDSRESLAPVRDGCHRGIDDGLPTFPASSSPGVKA